MDLRRMDLLTGDVARELRVSNSRVIQLERAGHLAARRTPSGVRLFRADQVEALRRRRAAARPTSRPAA